MLKHSYQDKEKQTGRFL